MNRSRGFTLIEVLVALAILAAALPALMNLVVQSVEGTAVAREKTMATWAADYVVQSRRLYTEERQWQQKSGQFEMADRRWYWRIDEQPTEMGELVAITISVGLQADNSLHEVILYEAQ